MTNLSIAFLIIISLAGAIYAFLSKQNKIALGLFIIAIAFILNIPGIVNGFWIDILLAISIIVYGLGAFVVVWKKKELSAGDKERENDAN